MNVVFKTSFKRDLARLHDVSLQARVAQALQEVEAAASVNNISHLNKMQGFSIHYRIRVGA